MTNLTEDRRISKRVNKLIGVTIELSSGGIPATTSNIGPGGAFIQTRQLVPLGKLIPLRLKLPAGVQGSILAVGRVVRHVTQPTATESAGFGVQWVRIHTRGDPRILENVLVRYFGSLERLPLEQLDLDGRKRTRPHTVEIVPQPAPTTRPAKPSKQSEMTDEVPVNLPITYQVRNMFLAGRLKAISRKTLFIEPQALFPEKGARTVIIMRIPHAVQKQRISMIAHVEEIQVDDMQRVLGFRARIESLDEHGNPGAYRAYVNKKAKK